MKIMDIIFVGIMFMMIITVTQHGQKQLAYGLQEIYKKLQYVERSCGEKNRN